MNTDLVTFFCSSCRFRDKDPFFVPFLWKGVEWSLLKLVQAVPCLLLFHSFQLDNRGGASAGFLTNLQQFKYIYVYIMPLYFFFNQTEFVLIASIVPAVLSTFAFADDDIFPV